jgi:hypothetical protein
VRSRKLDLALTLGIVLEVIEIFRRAPAWLRLVLGVAASVLLYLVIAYFWWIAGGLAAIALWRLAGLRIVRQRS